MNNFNNNKNGVAESEYMDEAQQKEWQNSMIKKMPIVGRKYRWIENPTGNKFGGIYVYLDWFSPELGRFECISGWEDGITEYQGLENFFDYFEEIPETQEPEKTRTVDEALNEMKNVVNSAKSIVNDGYFDMHYFRTAQNLIDAVEAEKDGNKQVESEKESEEESYKAAPMNEGVSIWKDIKTFPELTEYPKNTQHCILRLKDGTFENAVVIHQGSLVGFMEVGGEVISEEIITKYCTLTDFINAFEQMQKDIQELKKGR